MRTTRSILGLRRRTWSWVCVIVAIVVTAGTWLAGQQQSRLPPPPSPDAVVALAAGATYDRELKRGETHYYAFDLREGEGLRAVIEQRSLILGMTITGPDEREVMTIAGWGSNYGPTAIGLIAPSTGRFRLNIGTLRAADTGGRYQLAVQAAGELSADDRAYIATASAIAAVSMDYWQPKADNGPRTLRAFQEALPVWQARGDRRMQAQIETALGHVYKAHFYDSPNAAAHWERAIALWRELGDEWGEAMAQVLLSSALQTIGDVAGTLAARERARLLHHAAGRAAEEGEALDALAMIHIRLGDYQRSMELATDALARFREARDRRGEAFALTDLGLVHIRLGEWELALDRYREAQSLTEGDRNLQTIVRTQIGWAKFNLGEVDEARAALETSLAVCRELRFRSQEGNVLMNLTVLYADQGDIPKAIESGEAAVAIFRSTGDIDGQAVIAVRLGGLYARRGDPQAARAIYEAAFKLNPGVNPRTDAALHQGLGRLALEAGQFADARRHAEEGLALVESLRARLEHQRTRQSMLAVSQPLYELFVDVLMRQHAANPTAGHDAAALDVAERARARSLLELLGEGRGRVDVRTAADPALLDQERALRTRLNLAAESLTQAQRARATAVAAVAAAAAKTPGAASGSGGAPVSGGASVSGSAQASGGGRAAADRTATPDAAVQAATERVTTIERQIAASMETLAQIEVNLRRASPHYADLTAPTPLSTAALQRDVLDADTQLIEVMLGESASYLWVLSPTTLTSHRLPPRDEIERAARLFYEAASAPPTAARGANAVPADGRGYASSPAIGGGPGTSSTVAGESRASNGPGATGRGRTEAAPAAGSVSPVTPDEYERRARALSDLVLGPAAAALTAKRLVIVAPGMLQYVPFAGLPIPTAGRVSPSPMAGTTDAGTSAQSRGAARDAGAAGATQTTFEPLIARYEVVTAPSASVVATLRRERAERAAAPKGVVILADPVFDAKDPRVERSRTQAGGDAQARNRSATATRSPEVGSTTASSAVELAWRGVRGGAAADAITFGRLPFSRLEADAIVAAAPPGSAMKAVDFEASHAFATSPALADFRIVHFATHGVLHARQPDLSGVVLSLVDARGRPQDGFLRLHEIYNLQLNADLVVLSGCQTALGKAVRGEGLVGVTRGFMYAGAPRVVASLWQVDDLATSELMASFYRHLFGGKDEPAAALRAAQLELARSSRWRSPYFWAAFVLQGDWQAPRSAASASTPAAR